MATVEPVEPGLIGHMSVAVLGAGSWGTALAALIARHGHRTVLWGRDAKAIAALAATHENARYLPGVVLPESLQATDDMAAALGLRSRARRRPFARLRRNAARARAASRRARGRGMGDEGLRTRLRAFPARSRGADARRHRAAGRRHRPLVREGSRAGPAHRAHGAQRLARLRAAGRRRAARPRVPRVHRRRHAGR